MKVVKNHSEQRESERISNRFIAYLPDPALLNVELEGELGEHGSQGVGVSHLGHRENI